MSEWSSDDGPDPPPSCFQDHLSQWTSVDVKFQWLQFAAGQEGRNVKLLKLKLSNLWMWNACAWKPSWPLPPQPMPYIYIHISMYIYIHTLALISIRSVRCSAKCHELFGSVLSHWGYCWATVPSKGSGTARFELHSPVWIVTLPQRTT